MPKVEEIDDKQTLNSQDSHMDCPPQFQKYIDLANLIPANFVFPTIPAIYGYAFEHYRDTLGPVWIPDESIILAFKHVLKDSSENLFQYIFFLDDLNEIEKRYSLMSVLNHGIVSVAHAESWTFEDNDSTMNEQIQAIVENVPGIVPVQDSLVFVDRNGFLRPKNNEYFEFINDNDIPANRIRLCASCQKIFWAKNKTARFCSARDCANICPENWLNDEISELEKNRNKIYFYLKSLNKEFH